VIPIRNDIYYREAARLGIGKTNALALTDEVGLHPSLTALRELYDDGSLGILNKWVTLTLTVSLSKHGHLANGKCQY
jgi:uncharacterized protein (DUF1501 family)